MSSTSGTTPAPAGPVLALDTGSPRVSVAVASAEGVLASRSLPQASSSRELLPAVDGVLREAGLSLGDLGGLLALAGPGSFTGLRVGLAMVLGLHQATGLPATTVPTLEVLAAATTSSSRRVVAAIDARRGEWVFRGYGGEPRHSLGPSRRGSAGDIAAYGRELWPEADPPSVVITGFGVTGLELPRGPSPVEPPPLAPAAARRAFSHPISWDAAALTRPLYFRPPAVSLPGP